MTKASFPIQNWTIAVENSEDISLEILQIRGSKQQVQKKILLLLDEHEAKSYKLFGKESFMARERTPKEIEEDGDKLYVSAVSFLSGSKVYEVRITAVPYEQPTMLE